jgi:MFS family permease
VPPEPETTAAAPAAPVRGGRFGSFRFRPYLIYWIGALVSNMGTWLQSVAASVFVYQLTGSILAVGILNTVGFMPMVLFSVAGGTLADRFDRRHIVVAASFLSFVAAMVLAVMTWANAADEVTVTVIFVLLNTLYALSKPAMVSVIPNLVPREYVAEAVGWNSLAFIIGQIIGPVLATIILTLAGPAFGFGLNGVTYLAVIASMAYLYRRNIAGPDPNRLSARAKAASKEGAITYAGKHRWVWALLIAIVACTIPFEMVRTLAPAYVAEGLGEPEELAGVMMASHSFGAALCLGIIVPTLRRLGRVRFMAMLGIAMQAGGLAAGAFAPNLALAAVASAVIGAGFSMSFPVITGLLQEEVPDRVRGRILALHQLFHLGNRPFAAFVFGALAALVGAQFAYLGGVLLAPVGLLALRAAWRWLDRDPDREGARMGVPERVSPAPETAAVPDVAGDTATPSRG